MGHLKEFPNSIIELLDHTAQQWVPDAEYARGEFKVVTCYPSYTPRHQLISAFVFRLFWIFYKLFPTAIYVKMK